MTSRTSLIAQLLRSEQPTRQPLAYELRGSVVQLLGPGTTVPTWQAPPGLIAAAIDEALQKDTLRGIHPPEGESTARAVILRALQAAGLDASAAAETLARAYREPHADQPDPDFPETLAGGHALVVEYGDCDVIGSCQCGRALGRIRPNGRLDGLVGLWERHRFTEVGHG
ncbi:hypothetical protein [Streptomyces griseosporeus]|uniref:hypothetical protein n=1 Tax=Streptomyces griseosporeus TaxID=1910 RepID=UPI0036F5FACD